jgi:hypothetical protein
MSARALVNRCDGRNGRGCQSVNTIAHFALGFQRQGACVVVTDSEPDGFAEFRVAA